MLRVLSVCLLLIALAHADCPPYSYDDNLGNGPSDWASLCPEYYLCGNGTEQSPIDIFFNETEPTSNPVTIQYVASSNLLFYNNGIYVEVADGQTYPAAYNNTNHNNIISGGPLPHSYQLIRFHFHSESEHRFNGLRAPLEMHLVHQDSSLNVAVIGILFDYGEDNQFLDSIISQLYLVPIPAEGVARTNTTISNVDLNLLINDIPGYFSYNGSLTTPPCTQGIIWMVSTKVLSASQEQIDALAGDMPYNNYRPNQPLNGRVVYELTTTPSPSPYIYPSYYPVSTATVVGLSSVVFYALLLLLALFMF